MSQQQTSNAPTNADSQTPVSFADVSLTTLKSSFNDTFKVSKGSASQVVLGFQAMRDRLQDPSNEYQQVLYPKLKEFCDRLSTKYVETFLTTFSNDVERQVFGANLNGNRNNGSLYRAIPSGVNRNLTYNYAQFGQLTRVLTSRLRFIAQRDPSTVQRYRDSTDENTSYQKLQTNVNTFLTFLGDLTTEWNTLVTETRGKFTASETQTNTTHQRQSRQPREPREPREQRTQRFNGQNRQSQQSHQSFDERQPRQQREQQVQDQQGQQRQSRQQYKSVRQSSQNDGGDWTSPRVTVRNTRTARTVPKSSVVV